MGVIMKDVFPVLILLMVITDSLVIEQVRDIMFDFATGLGHRSRKRREIKRKIYSSISDVVTLRKLSNYIKDKNIIDKYHEYYSLHSILLCSIPLQWVVVLIGCLVNHDNKVIPCIICIVAFVLKSIVSVVLLTKVDANKVSKYVKKK